MAEQPPATLPADFFEKQGAAPPSTLPADFDFDKAAKPGVISRFVSGTGIVDTAKAIGKPDHLGETSSFFDPQIAAAKNVADIAKSIGSASLGHLNDAIEAAKKGDWVGAHHAAVYAIPALGEMGAQAERRFKEGDVAGGVGGLTALVAPEAFKAAGKIPVPDAIGNARSDLAVGAKAFVAKPPAAQAVPGTSAMPPAVMDALALNPKTATLGSLLKRLSNASDAVDNNRGARAPVQEPTGGHVFAPERQAPASTERAPIWEGNSEPAPTRVTLGDISTPSRADLQAILDGRRAEALASDPRSAPAAISRIKALGSEPAPSQPATLAEVARNPVETFNRIARAGMISDFLKQATRKLGYSEADLKQLQTENPARFDQLVEAVSRTPEGTQVGTWWRPSTKAASGKTRAMVQERVSPTEPRTPAESEDMSDLLQQSLDALKSKKGRK